MKCATGRWAPTLTFSLAVLLSGLVTGAAPPSPSPTPAASPAASVPSATLTATVRSVDAQARTMEVVTGVGHALRVVKVSWKAPPAVKAAAAGAGMAQLKPGDLVRLEYAKAPDGNVVRTIELLPRPAVQGVQ
jgi:hypothetical protein